MNSYLMEYPVNLALTSLYNNEFYFSEEFFFQGLFVFLSRKEEMSECIAWPVTSSIRGETKEPVRRRRGESVESGCGDDDKAWTSPGPF
jgi:hypothetical protein